MREALQHEALRIDTARRRGKEQFAAGPQAGAVIDKADGDGVAVGSMRPDEGVAPFARERVHGTGQFCGGGAALLQFAERVEVGLEREQGGSHLVALQCVLRGCGSGRGIAAEVDEVVLHIGGAHHDIGAAQRGEPFRRAVVAERGALARGEAAYAGYLRSEVAHRGTEVEAVRLGALQADTHLAVEGGKTAVIGRVAVSEACGMLFGDIQALRRKDDRVGEGAADDQRRGDAHGVTCRRLPVGLQLRKSDTPDGKG